MDAEPGGGDLRGVTRDSSMDLASHHWSTVSLIPPQADELIFEYLHDQCSKDIVVFDIETSETRLGPSDGAGWSYARRASKGPAPSRTAPSCSWTTTRGLWRRETSRAIDTTEFKVVKTW